MLNDMARGIVYADKLRWAIYSPASGKIRHGDLGNAPESEGFAHGFGYQISPFFKPQEGLIRLCLRLSDWWKELKKRYEHQGGGESNETFTFCKPRPKREHRLISEAGPDVPPHGYFDCTVEVRLSLDLLSTLIPLLPRFFIAT